jgi:hypothetical protein
MNTTEQANNQTKTIHDLHQAFATLAFSYGIVNHDSRNNLPIGTALVCLEGDCEKLVMIAQAIRLQSKGGAI